MANPLKRLLGETALYGISSVLGRVLNFLLVPLYTQILPEGDYGIVTDLYAFVAFFLVVYTYGMETAYFRHATKQPANGTRYFRSATTSILLTSLLFSCILASQATSIVQYLEYPGREEFVYWLVLVLAIDAITAIPFARLRLRRQARTFATVKLVGIVTNIGLNLFFIVLSPQVHAGQTATWLQPFIERIYTPGWDVEYIFISNLLGNAFMLLLLLPSLRAFRPELRWAYLRPMVVYAYPLLFMGMAGVINDMTSRAFLKQLMPEGYYPNYTNQQVLGIFGACYKLAVFMNLAVQAFRYAAEPFFFSRASDKNSPRLFAQVMHGFVLLGCLMLLGLTVNLDWVAPIMLRQPSYLEALHIVPVLLLGNLFLGIYFNLSVWFKLTDQTYYGTGIAIGGAILTVILNVLLIPRMGYEGATLVTVIVYASMTVANYYLGQKHYPIPYLVRRGLAYMIVCAGLAFGIRYGIADWSFILRLLVGNGALLLLVAVVWKFERHRFQQL